MNELDDYRVFAAIVELGSLTAAARAHGRSLQAVSRLLARLERELGTQLIRRTTRSLQPTPAGLAFAHRIRPVLAELDAARAEARSEAEHVAGALRIAAPALLAASHVGPMVARFLHRWPDLRVELVVGDRPADLLSEKLDFAVRIGELADSTLRARPLARLRRVFFAAPEWVRRHGLPATPEALAQLPCVVRTIGPERGQWPYQDGATARRVKVAGVFRANDAATCNEAVAQGLGAGMAALWQVRRLLDEGRVQLILQDHEPPPQRVQAVWHGTLPAAARLLVDHLALQFGATVA
ncbi:DNA-binding transcriptional LysR family regulator [Pseudoduganella flava]|uniref:DNA-binding transcriptional LysR family regulator n=1 Tax=Pseudoduganella flava TaxID=871742 RepID=A0A562PID0_9BURK|nr:LysR family transcriptional regulator [Pseudoduganella flava]QGZ42805.1 LysR family transcriptional regulator [Pseudoduganella flava]TWI44093.1 DNA-binding transcriptional LysR family regulator [Pseudoduganella flava]